LIDFIAPTTDLSRIKKIANTAKGFIYYVSLTGVTGVRDKLPRDILERINFLKKFIKIPICVGFGISNKEQFKAIVSFSDGVIVGSAIIRKIKENLRKKDLIYRIIQFTKTILPY
jgi:tryptophan synthase alpha chain